MKASERRAFDHAVRFVRCPSCNRMGVRRATGYGNDSRYDGYCYCGACGWAGTVAVTFHQRETHSGFRTVAEVG